MRGKLWLLPAVLVGLAVLGCPTDDDVKKVDDKIMATRDSLKIWADSVTLYLGATHNAICELAKKTSTPLPDPTRYKCPPPGPGEGTPPPKYPPQ
jgi:hypothetical protein